MPLTSQQALDCLRRALAHGHLAHAYILSGPVEEVERETLRPLLGELLRTERPEIHPDLHRIAPASKSRQILTEKIDELIFTLNQSPFTAGGKKIALICHADRMNTASANKFLKTLEEPHPRTHIFLLTERPSALLPTIRSRCGIIALRQDVPLPEPEAIPLVNSVKQPFTNKLAALLWSRSIEEHLVKKSIQIEKDIFESHKETLKQLEAEGREFLEKEISGQAASATAEYRALLFAQLTVAIGPTRPNAIEAIEQAHRDLQRNLPLGLVLDRMALQVARQDVERLSFYT